MSDITTYEANGLQPIDPAGRGLELSIRFATQEDFACIDVLQKSENDKLGFMPESAIRKRIEQHNVLVAETTGNIAGYCLGVDRYQKRSELGIIYQMAVAPEYRRCNVAAALLQAQFDKSAYGTKLYCCWCKQSLDANRFWESMGFVPLAFRAGARARSKKQAEKPKIHIFWQKRIRAGDEETPWWYPYETQGGAMMEGRVVLPLPPDMQWDQAVPVVLPGAEKREEEQRLLEAKVDEIAAAEKEVKKGARNQGPRKSKAGNAKGPRVEEKAKKKSESRAVMSYGFGAGSGFGKPVEQVPTVVEESIAIDDKELERLKAEKVAAKAALKAAQRKNDPELVAYARELRDRWQEHVAASPGMIEDRQKGKYAAARLLSAGHAEGTCELNDDANPIVKRLDAA